MITIKKKVLSYSTFLCDKYFFLILTKLVGIVKKLLYTTNKIMKLTNKGRYAVMAMAT